MTILANARRQAKAEFENNLWEQRFKELNGFTAKEGFGKTNVIMPYSEQDYIENKSLDKNFIK